jgi:3-hydroxybutyryl-CoA dehydrogenase
MNGESAFKRVGVVGLGQMGCGIAQVIALSGYHIRALDVDKGLVDRAINRMEQALKKMVHKGSIEDTERESVLSRIEYGTDLEVLRDCDLIIEAVYEDFQTKKQLFQRLDDICPEHTIFASNTSTLSITSLASGLNRSERFLGLHFFNPVPSMKLVELVKTLATSQAAITAVVDFAKSLGKIPIVVRDQAGFVVNFLLTPFLFDAIRSLSSGLATVSDIDNGMRYGCGHPMGPLALSDLIGLDILAKAGDLLYEEFRDARFAVPPLLKRLVALGYLGAKSGLGFYDYSDPEGPRPRDLI